MQEVFEAYRKYDSLEKVNTYLNRVFEANLLVLEEVLAMSSAAVRDVIYRHIEKDGIVDRIKEDGKRDVAFGMLKDGVSPDKVARYLQMPLEWVQSLKK